MNIPEDQQEWRRKSKCRDLSIEQADKLFFFGPGGSPVRAKKFCDSCPVQRACLHFALIHNEEGIWAGTTYDERRIMQDYITIDRILSQGLVIRETRATPENGRLTREHELIPVVVLEVEYLEIELDLDIFSRIPGYSPESQEGPDSPNAVPAA